MVKPFVVGQNFLHNVNSYVSEFINRKLSPSAVVNYSIESGSSFKAIGQQGKGFGITTQGLLRTSYSFAYPDLSVEDTETLREFAKAVINNRSAIAFNDPSDNYVFDYGSDGVFQFGTMREVVNKGYRAFKVYQAGKKRAYYPIYFFDADSEIKIDGQTLGNWTVNRETGLFSSPTDLSGKSFETDLYYKRVKITEPPEITHKAASGILPEIQGYSNVDAPIACEQTFNVSMKLEDIFLTESVKDVVTKTNAALDDIPFLNLTKYQNDLAISDVYNTPLATLGSNIFSPRQTDNAEQKMTKITIPSRELGVKELNYWKTIYLATSGGSFFL